MNFNEKPPQVQEAIQEALNGDKRKAQNMARKSHESRNFNIARKKQAEEDMLNDARAQEILHEKGQEAKDEFLDQLKEAS